MITTLRQLSDLAPDAATLDRAQPLLQLRRWRSLTAAPPLVWGECKSRGAAYFKVVVDLKKETFYCTCSSVKLPCKHSLALMGLAVQQSESFSQAEETPDWLVESRGKMVNKAEVAARRIRSTEDEQRLQELRQKNREGRIAQMQAGVLELERWMHDLLRQGLAGLETQPPAFWEEVATRLVNAKLSGIARRIRKMPDLFQQPDWPSRLLEELGQLHLFVQGFQQLGELPPSLEEELLSVGGIHWKKEEVLQGKGCQDTWLVVGLVTGVEDNLNFRRTWLVGKQSRRKALLLDYVWGDASFEEQWEVGMQVEGALFYYPGAAPLRAVWGLYQKSPSGDDFTESGVTLTDFAREYAKNLGENPWLPPFPAFLREVVPLMDQGRYWLADAEGRAVEMRLESEAFWKMMALSAGHPLAVFGEWEGGKLTVLSVVEPNRVVEV